MTSPWTFDTGLSAATRTLVRDAVVGLLAPLGVAAGGWLPTGAIRGLGFSIKGGSDDRAYEMLLAEFAGQPTAVGVALARLETDTADTSGLTLVGDQVIEVYVMSKHLRGTTEGRVSGDVAAAASRAVDPGIDVMLQLVVQYVHGAAMGVPGVDPPLLAVQEEIDADTDHVMWRVVFTARVAMTINPSRGAAPLAGLVATLRPAPSQAPAIVVQQPPGPRP